MFPLLAQPEKGGRGAARPCFLLAEAARSECAPSMRAVKDSLAAPLGKNLKNQKALARAYGTSRRASGWAGENDARSQEHPARFLLGEEALANQSGEGKKEQ